MDFSTPLFCCLTQTEEWKQNLFCWNILLNLFCAERDGVGLMCRGRGMNTMHLTPTAWIQYMRARGGGTLLKSLLFRGVGVGAATGKDGWGLVSVFTCLGESSLLPCGLHSIGYSQLLGELGSLVAPTWDAQNLCNCICILYLVLALNFCILNLVFGEGGLFSRLPRGMLRLFVRGQCSEAACSTMEEINLNSRVLFEWMS